MLTRKWSWASMEPRVGSWLLMRWELISPAARARCPYSTLCCSQHSIDLCSSQDLER